MKKQLPALEKNNKMKINHHDINHHDNVKTNFSLISKLNLNSTNINKTRKRDKHPMIKLQNKNNKNFVNDLEPRFDENSSSKMIATIHPQHPKSNNNNNNNNNNDTNNKLNNNNNDSDHLSNKSGMILLIFFAFFVFFFVSLCVSQLHSKKKKTFTHNAMSCLLCL